MDAITMKIRSEINLIPIPLGAVRAYAKEIFEDDKTVERIVLALEEALNNVFRYSMSRRLEEVTVTADAHDGEFTVSVIDKGLPGDYESILQGDDRIGLTIMQNSVDEIAIENLGMDGRRQKLIKYYASLPESFKQKEIAEEKPIENAEITIRTPKKDEMLKISRAFYNEYGLTYVNDTFYYPERLFAAISKGRIHSTIAVDQYGGLAGHHGAIRWSTVPGIWEAGMAIVNKNYRNMGIFKKLMPCTHHFVEHEAKGRMVCGCCVTTHPYSQKTRLKNGSFPCAFAFNVFPPELAQSSFKDDVHRTSEAIAASIFDFTPKTVYLPEEVHEAACFIYGGMKLEREIKGEGGDFIDETTVSKGSFSNRCKTGEINLVKIGKDYESHLNTELSELKKQGAESVTLFLSLENPAAIAAYEAAKKLGFFFCGILPNADQGDVMRMQKMLTHTVDYEAIVTTDEFTTLYNMIRAFDPDLK